MPLLRERSKLVPRKEIIESHLNTKWTLREKKKLLVALRKLKPDNLEQIRLEYLPQRTEKEIYWFIERMKSKGYRKPNISRPRVPIELWERMAEELTCHDVDYSYALSEVFQKIADEEQHFPKNLPENPDWKMIYLYIVALLKGDETPEVGQIEAAVLLDLTEALGKHLKSLDLTGQQSVMIKKYDLLAARVNARNSEEASELTKKALEEDPLKLNGSEQNQQSTINETSTDLTAARSSSQQSTETQPIVIAPLASPGEKATTSQSSLESNLRFIGMRSNPSKRGRKKKTVDNPLSVSDLQKTSLYSINPFCIPIRYLNPKAKPTPPSCAAIASAPPTVAASSASQSAV